MMPLYSGVLDSLQVPSLMSVFGAVNTPKLYTQYIHISKTLKIKPVIDMKLPLKMTYIDMF